MKRPPQPGRPAATPPPEPTPAGAGKLRGRFRRRPAPAAPPAPDPAPAPSPEPTPVSASAPTEPIPTVVDYGLAAKREKKQRRRKLSRKRRRIAWIAGGSGVAAVLAILYFTPLFALHLPADCHVKGMEAPTQKEVCEALADWDRASLFTLNTAAMSEQVVKKFVPVASAKVEKAYPQGVNITLTPRIPLAAVKINGKLMGVDKEAVALELAGPQLEALPKLDLQLKDGDKATAKIVRALVDVLDSMPPELRGRVVAGQAKGVENLSFKLASGGKLTWGANEDNADKAQIALLLYNDLLREIDVSTPRTPSTR